MADTPKSPSLLKPAAGSVGNLYTAPGGLVGAMGSTLWVNNEADEEAEFWVYISPNGADPNPIIYQCGGVGRGQVIGSRNPLGMTIGWSLASGDIVKVKSSNGLVSFAFFPMERT